MEITEPKVKKAVKTNEPENLIDVDIEFEINLDEEKTRWKEQIYILSYLSFYFYLNTFGFSLIFKAKFGNKKNCN